MSSHAPKLVRYAWLSVAAAVATIALKVAAYYMTGSVGLLSDAAESLVNLAAALVAVVVLRQVRRPADSRFAFGRSKAEYFSSGLEGGMILVAAGVIIVEAIMRFLRPVDVVNIGPGLAVSAVAAVLNGVVGFLLLRAGRKHRSQTLKADGTHLLTDVVTSVGVIIGVGLVALTGWQKLDPIVAIIVALNITLAGVRLVREAMHGLMDVSLPPEDIEKIRTVLESFSQEGVAFHGLQTRVSGSASFANIDLLVPGDWSVRKGHDYAECVSSALCEQVEGLRLFVHVEPIEDPLSYDDIPTGSIPLAGIEATEPPRNTSEQ
ncbi:MAG: cation transporter [Actinomycetaceae bacterium]|nr:cation transporter [Actinomycetaceae bacterium]